MSAGSLESVVPPEGTDKLVLPTARLGMTISIEAQHQSLDIYRPDIPNAWVKLSKGMVAVFESAQVAPYVNDYVWKLISAGTMIEKQDSDFAEKVREKTALLYGKEGEELKPKLADLTPPKAPLFRDILERLEKGTESLHDMALKQLRKWDGNDE